LSYIHPELATLVADAKSIYNKIGSSRICAQHPDDGQFSTDSVDDLLTDFICEYGPSHREFGYNSPLVIELAHSKSLQHLRANFYFKKGANYSGRDHQMSLLTEAPEAKVLDLVNGCTITTIAGISTCVTVMDFIGGYDWDVYQTPKGTVRFEISDKKDLVSGTRINTSRQGAKDISLEQYLQSPQKYNRGNFLDANLALFDWSSYNIISVLSEKSSQSRNPYNAGGLGGGTMTYSYAWEEKYMESWTCPELFIQYGTVLDALPIPDNKLLPATR
jgi:hypothetical protein